MPTCEKCWADSADGFDHAEKYRELVEKRDREGRTCTPEQQAGEFSKVCNKCGRKAVHQWCNVCMACGEPVEEVSDE